MNKNLKDMSIDELIDFISSKNISNVHDNPQILKAEKFLNARLSLLTNQNINDTNNNLSSIKTRLEGVGSGLSSLNQSIRDGIDSNTALSRANNNNARKTLFFTFVLAATAIWQAILLYQYTDETRKLVSVSKEQMLLAAEPNIELESNTAIALKEDNFCFKLANLSPVNLRNIKFYSRYITHIIDDNLTESFLHRGAKISAPDSVVKKLSAKSEIPACFNYRRSGLLEKDDNAFYLLGDISNPIKIPVSAINKFHNVTFAEYTIEYQRELDGKVFDKSFYYQLTMPYDSPQILLIRSNKEDILNNNRETAKILKMIFLNKETLSK